MLIRAKSRPISVCDCRVTFAATRAGKLTIANWWHLAIGDAAADGAGGQHRPLRRCLMTN